MRIEISPEARCALALPPLASGQMMELHVDTDKLLARLAEELRQREERLLQRLVDRVLEHLGRARGSQAVPTAGKSAEILGVHPHALYSVSFVADRWNVSPDNVRKKSQEELPRAGWQGGEIRYRGVDILRYEGVGVEAYLDESSFQLEGRRASQFPEAQESDGWASAPAEENRNRRPYNSDLPALSDEPTSTD